MVDIISCKLFYPMLFTSITIIGLTIIMSVGIVKVKGKDNNLFNNIFNRHVDEHIDTTDKMKDITIESLQRDPVNVEQEFHSLHVEIKDTNQRVTELAEDINQKLDIMLSRIIKLEQNK